MQSGHLFSKTEFGLDKRRSFVYNNKQMFLRLWQKEQRKINSENAFFSLFRYPCMQLLHVVNTMRWSPNISVVRFLRNSLSESCQLKNPFRYGGLYMAKKSLHRIQPQKTINRIRINPDTLTPQQREETLSRIQVPVTAVFTEDPHPEVFRQVRSILLSACRPTIEKTA